MAAQELKIDNVERQRRYVEEQQSKGEGMGVVFAGAFLRGMRDIGYKSPAWALSELVDNSYQAGADRVSIGYGFHKSNKSRAKPDMLAIVDNGNGMIPEMISYAVRWGGTDREDDRSGFGRYGYGLPSAAVSMAKMYTVYSKSKDSDWHCVVVDIDELAKVAGRPQETAELLTATREAPPKWVNSATPDLDIDKLESGTVVVLEDLDRLKSTGGWITIDRGLQPKLLKHLGVVYRHFIPAIRIAVGGDEVRPVDPLFLMENAQFVDENHVRAECVLSRTIEMATNDGGVGLVRVRAAYLTPGFGNVDPERFGQGGPTNTNKRYQVMKEYNGILVCRAGRQIDCVQPWWTSFQNNDRHLKIEVDFDPELDDCFGITTAKQQIVIKEDFRQFMTGNGKAQVGLANLVADMRARFKKDKAEIDARRKNVESEETTRPSEEAMAETANIKEKAVEPSAEEQEKAKRRFEEVVKQQVKDKGEPEEKVRKELEAQVAESGWKVRFTSIPEGPFFSVERMGQRRDLIINTDHPFYSKVHQAHDAAAPALEILLFVLAERELEAEKEFKEFYRVERQRWSQRLRYALDHLVEDQNIEDTHNAVAEELLADMA